MPKPIIICRIASVSGEPREIICACYVRFVHELRSVDLCTEELFWRIWSFVWKLI